jgi:beta-lactamase class A
MRCMLICICALVSQRSHMRKRIQAKSMQLLEKIKATLAQEKGTYRHGLYRSADKRTAACWNEHENFHAASTMKTPVMIEVFKQVGGRVNFPCSKW